MSTSVPSESDLVSVKKLFNVPIVKVLRCLNGIKQTFIILKQIRQKIYYIN